MSTSVKIGFFLVAVTTMVCFAVASILMASGNGWAAFGLFVVAFALITVAFVTKRKVLRKDAI